MEPIKQGELKANDAVIYFDNICDENGRKLTKSEKRSRLKDMMKNVYDTPELNVCILSDGKAYPLIVCRQNPGRAKFYYFNNVDAPKEEILQAFAKNTGITCKKETYTPKKEGELIANDAKQLLDEVCENGIKLTGPAKLKKLHEWFATIYNTPQKNLCLTPKGEIPIIVRRQGVNNKTMLCLNTSEYQTQVMQAFAKAIGARYLSEKENAEILAPKQEGEMTARECARIFHNVESFDKSNEKRNTSPKLVEWFEHIASSPKLNNVKLPSGEEKPLVVRRKSNAQQCVCLNVSSEYAKPFIIRKVAMITHAEVCLDNLTLSQRNPKELYQAMLSLKKQEKDVSNEKDRNYYKAYAQKIFEFLHLNTDEMLLKTWLEKKSKGEY